MIGSYPGTEISGSVARMKVGGADLGDANVWVTASAGVAGRDALYTAAGANLADGDIGIIDSGGTPVAFRYSDAARNWVRLNPFSNSNAVYAVEDAKTNGFRNQDATTVGWTDSGSDYTYSAPDHIFDADPSPAARLDTVDTPFAMSEVGFIILDKVLVQTGATGIPIFDLRRNVSGSPYQNLRLQPASGTWQISSVSTSDTGVAYAQNTEYSFEVYYDYATGRAWVYHNYSATPTLVNNSAITLPTTTGSTSGLLLMNVAGIMTMEGAAFGHLRAQL